MNGIRHTLKARITAALEYLQHEVDPIRAIPLAERQLKEALAALTATEPGQARRSDDASVLTFVAGARVPANPWPPAEKGKA